MEFEDGGILQEFTSLINKVSKRETNPMYEVPPVLCECKDYQRATSTGYRPKDASTEREKHSLMFKENVPFSFCDNTRSFSHMGTGYATYFIFIMFLVVMACVPLALTGGFLIYQNWKGGDCRSGNDLSSWKSVLADLRNQTAAAAADNQYAFTQLTAEHLTSFTLASCLIQHKFRECDKFKELDCRVRMTEECLSLSVKMFNKAYPGSMCFESGIMRLSSANNLSYYIAKTDLWRDIVIYATVGILFLLICYFHYYHSLANVQLDLEYPSVEDCSIKIENVPKNLINCKNRIIDTFYDYGYSVVHCVLSYDIDDMIRLKIEYEAKNTELALKRYERILNPDRDDDVLAADIAYIEKEVDRINAKIKIKESQFDDGMGNGFDGVAYASLYTVKDKVQVLNEFGSQSLLSAISSMCDKSPKLVIHDDAGKAHSLKLTSAPPPSDVIWENQGYTSSDRYLRKIVSRLVSLILIIIDFFGVYTIEMLAIKLIDSLDEKDTGTYRGFKVSAIQAGVSTLIFCFDKIIEMILDNLANFEKPATLTMNHQKTVQKVWKVQWLTSGVVPLLVSIHAYKFYGCEGLYNMINSLLLTYIILTPVFGMIEQPSIYLNQIMRWWIKKRLLAGESCKMTQYQANKIFMKSDFVIWMQYSSLLRYTSLVFFFMPMMPICVLYYLIFLGVNYVSDKLVLIHLCNKNNRYTGYISKRLIGELEIMPAFFVLGLMVNQAVIDLTLLRTVTINKSYLILLCLLLISYLLSLPKTIVGTPEFTASDSEKVTGRESYFDILRVNPEDYNMTNPATSEVGRNHNVQMFYAAGVHLDKLPIESIIDKFIFGDLGINANHIFNLLDLKTNMIKPLQHSDPKDNITELEYQQLDEQK